MAEVALLVGWAAAAIATCRTGKPINLSSTNGLITSDKRSRRARKNLPPRELSFLCSHRLQTQPHSNCIPVRKLDAKRLEGAHYSGYCVEAASKWLGSALLHGAY
jgi:hypothetical protein